MGALYGILGGADQAELLALGNRLAHRGREAADWSPGRDLHIGIRGPRRIVDVQEHGPVAFEGAIDNRSAIARFLRRRQVDALGPADDAGLVFELIDSVGPEGLALLAGQFAIAFWHGPERRLLLARDRMGYSPLFFTTLGGRFAFASEYKALLGLNGVVARPNLHALQVVLDVGRVDPGCTCLEGIFPVAPGSCLEVRPGRLSSRRYWEDAIPAAGSGDADRAKLLREVLLGALKRQVAGYGRIGVSLGGNLGSALVAAGAATVANGREVHTFSAGYGPDDRRLVNAARTARALGTRHHAVVLDPEDLDSLLPWMVWHLEEPAGGEETGYLFAEAREAACHVTLVLAGFELDASLGNHRWQRLTDLVSGLPALRGPINELHGYAARGVPPVSLGGRVLKAACYHGREVGGPRYPSSLERIYAGAGVRFGSPCTDPAFFAARATSDIRELRRSTLWPSFTTAAKDGDRQAHEVRLSDALERMAVELLSPGVVRQRGLVDPGYVAALLRRDRGRTYSAARSGRIWSMLLMEIWAGTFLDRTGSAPDHSPPVGRRLDATMVPAASPAAGPAVGRTQG